jgi:hypothetical protein
MNHSRLFRLWCDFLRVTSLILPILLFASASYAQTPTLFTGKWKFDRTKSDPGKDASFSKEEQDILDIVQYVDSITINKTVLINGVVAIVITDRYSLDGKEKITINNSKRIKGSATWSKDRKSLTITTKVPDDHTEYRLDDTYSLSKDGKILSIRSVFEHPQAGIKRTLVYVKQ